MLIFTPIYASLLALLMIYLALRVALLRRKHKVGIGSNGNNDLSQAIRVHANATEYIPIALLLLAFTELSAAPVWLVNLAGILLVVSRVIHAYGLGNSMGISFGRFYGTSITWLTIIGLSGYLITVKIIELIHL